MWRVVICTQVVQCLSIISACIPYLKPFLESLESGLMRADDLRRRDNTGLYGSKGESGGSGYNSSNKSSKFGRLKRPHELSTLGSGGNAIGFGRNDATVIAGGRDTSDWDTDSRHSRSKIIRETRTWMVAAESAGGGTHISSPDQVV